MMNVHPYLALDAGAPPPTKSGMHAAAEEKPSKRHRRM
jgi:hypothetical protein